MNRMLQTNERKEILTRIGGLLTARGGFLTTAESCTGGLIAAEVTRTPGASEWFAGGVVTYSNEMKTGLLGVSGETLAGHGAVSEATVREMAAGALRISGGADSICASVAVSGVAGPSGGSPAKPVGTVCIACAVLNAEGVVLEAQTRLFSGDRDSVREQTVDVALAGVAELLEKSLDTGSNSRGC